MEKLLIRKVELRDADDVSRIREAITKRRSTADYKRFVEEEVQKEDRIGFVAELDGKIVGFMIAYIIYGGFGLEKSAWIGVFGVEPKYMDSGIGTRLSKRIFDVLRERGIKNIFTSVRWDSTDLLSFFKSLGFDRCEFINLKKMID